MNEKFKKLGFYPADIMLPKDADMSKWSVVACDQFTSQPEYWHEAERIAGGAPSTLSLILPEAKLNNPDVDECIKKINASMEDYIEKGVFKTYENSLFYIERTQSDGAVRHGLIGMVDLDCYDFTPGSGALIRATEGTVLSRIPPRVKVRKDAPIELPHIMVLIDDPKKTVIEPLIEKTGDMEKLYDFELMLGGGHLKGYKLNDAQTDGVADALFALTGEDVQNEKYGLSGSAPLLFAMGDGNHSLATAKQHYEDMKKLTPQEKWAELKCRFALVELVNNHDDALKYAPIHRVLFNVDPKAVLSAFIAAYPGAYEGRGKGHVIEYCYEGKQGYVTVPNPGVQLAVGTLQSFLDDYLKDNGGEVDYIHGDDVTRNLGSKPGCMGFLLPCMAKEDLFKTVIKDGVTPRKTFSLGHAEDKRYYTEARRIR